tara:strand:+ start:1310 stop:1447 length:138 start_codon:yes stop_codon:yes gene_type:complete
MPGGPRAIAHRVDALVFPRRDEQELDLEGKVHLIEAVQGFENDRD